ncbi:MAG TPA: ATP-binding protein [Chitinophagaceae bacterium]|nr:ATP-binding protein [Chitinophagaceae bacterium]
MFDFILDKFYLFFQGLLIFQCIFFIAVYLFTRKKDIAYYAAFLLVTILYFFINAPQTFFGIDDNIVFNSKYYLSTNILVILSYQGLYILFINAFIGELASDALTTKVFRYCLWSLPSLAVMFIIGVYLKWNSQPIFYISNFVTTFYGIWVIRLLIKRGIPFTKFVTYGIIFSIIGNFFTLLMIVLDRYGYDNILTVSYPLLFMRLGLLADIFFYQMAILNKWHYQEKQLLIKEIESRYIINEMKTKISQDLHDDIGSTLNSISLFAEVAKKRVDKNENIQDLVGNISTISKDMMSKMSDIVWSLKAGNETVQKLYERLHNYCTQSLTPLQIEYSFEINPELNHYPLNSEMLKEIYLIAKEAINNSMKYAACSHVNIYLIKQHNNLIMKIKDDGKGFNRSKQYQGLGGEGLKNMQARAEAIGGKIEIESLIDKGTTVTLLIPYNK